jgi:hypothetical protein
LKNLRSTTARSATTSKLHPLAILTYKSCYHRSTVRCRNTFDSYSIRSTIAEASQSCQYLPPSCALIDTPLATIVFASRQTRNNVYLTRSSIYLPPSTNLSTKSASPVRSAETSATHMPHYNSHSKTASLIKFESRTAGATQDTHTSISHTSHQDTSNQRKISFVYVN